MFWRRSFTTIDAMLAVVGELGPQSTRAFAVMRQTREAINAALTATISALVLMTRVKASLQDARRELSEAKVSLDTSDSNWDLQHRCVNKPRRISNDIKIIPEA